MGSVSPAAAVAPRVTANEREPLVYRHDTTRGRRNVKPGIDNWVFH